MAVKFELKLTDDQFYALHAAADRKAKQTRVSTEVLRVLLNDHSAMIRALGIKP